jgi:hypothetical protein
MDRAIPAGGDDGARATFSRTTSELAGIACLSRQLMLKVESLSAQFAQPPGNEMPRDATASGRIDDQFDRLHP